MYAEDYDSKLVQWFCGENTSGNLGSEWYELIQPYMKNRTLIKCPSFDPREMANGGIPYNEELVPAKYPGYTYNWFMMSRKGGYRVEQARRPDHAFVHADSSNTWRSETGCTPDLRAVTPDNPMISYEYKEDFDPKFRIGDVAWANACATSDSAQCQPATKQLRGFGIRYGGPYKTIEYTRHQGGSNVAFLDGHVKWLPLDKITFRNLIGDPYPGYDPNW